MLINWICGGRHLLAIFGVLLSAADPHRQPTFGLGGELLHRPGFGFRDTFEAIFRQQDTQRNHGLLKRDCSSICLAKPRAWRGVNTGAIALRERFQIWPSAVSRPSRKIGRKMSCRTVAMR